MGICLRKHAHKSTNKLSDFPQPDTEDGIQISGCRTSFKPFPARILTVSSDSLKVRGSKYVKDSFPATATGWLIWEVNEKDDVLHEYKVKCYCFPYSVLKAATQNFSEKNFIVQAGFGEVYKGYINFSTMRPGKPSYGASAIAVKRLKKDRQQGHHEWLDNKDTINGWSGLSILKLALLSPSILSKLNHPNVANLIGYCCEEHEKQLEWSTRIKIAVGAARALEHLHNNRKLIIHRDVNASNILLDSEFNAKLSDFGLAKFGSDGAKGQITTRVFGTQGYFAPEYVAIDRLTLKTDVYSFGVVLLEILSGCGAVRTCTDGQTRNLVQWAKPHLRNTEQLHHVIDKKLDGHIPMEEAEKLAKIILRCPKSNPKARPTMAEVVDLEQLLQPNKGSQKAIDFYHLLAQT